VVKIPEASTVLGWIHTRTHTHAHTHKYIPTQMAVFIVFLYTHSIHTQCQT
jgi:hypothetical protein